MNILQDLLESDPVISNLINSEKNRQETHLELIASENFASMAVMQAQGSVLTNKYAEGLPQKRYYGGCEFVDEIEELAIDRAKQLFNAPVNMSGKWFNAVHYGVDEETQKLNFNKIREIALATKPKLIICGYSAYPRTIDFESFRKIADEVGAFLMADIAHIAGLVASKLHPNPIPHCDVVTTTTHKTLRGPRGGLILCKDKEFGKKLDKSVFPGTQGGPLEHIIAAKAVAFGEALHPNFVNYSKQVIKNAKVLASTLINRGIDIVSGGTDNHIVLLDLRSINMTGKVADLLVSEVNITANKNTVPFDPESPFVTSGLRLGTAALTTRGFSEDAFNEVGEIIADRLLNPDDLSIEKKCKERVLALCNRFPLYEGKLESSIK